jgi:hypothetical protein
MDRAAYVQSVRDAFECAETHNVLAHPRGNRCRAPSRAWYRIRLLPVVQSLHTRKIENYLSHWQSQRAWAMMGEGEKKKRRVRDWHPKFYMSSLERHHQPV